MITFDDDDATDTRTIEDRRRLQVCDQIENLIAGVAEAHTGLAIRQLAPLLPEPQQSRLRALLAEADWIQIPMEVK